MRADCLVAVTTCHARREQADAQRRTWAKDRADTRFFVGPGPVEHLSEVVLDVDDSYQGLPAKVRATCRWALENGYRSVLKVDDDVYLVPNRVPDYEGLDYVGNFRMHNGNGYPHDYASGFAYFLSEAAMQVVASSELTEDTMEDRWLGNLLGATRGTKTLDEKRFACTYPCGIDEAKFLWGSPVGKKIIAAAQYPASQFEHLQYWYRRTFEHV